jgi:hypothetical protein
VNTHAVHLSVVVVPVGGPEFVRRCLTALLAQSTDQVEEIVVPYDAQAADYDWLAESFPAATFLPVECDSVLSGHRDYAVQHEVYDTLKARGIDACQGEIIALIEDTVIPDHDWSAQVVTAHRLPHAVIGGAVEYAGCGHLAWAVYFMDFGRYGLPLTEGPQPYLTDVNVAYKTTALEASRDLWGQRYHEIELHTGLMQRGATLWLRPQIVVSQDRGPLRFNPVLRERFEWGWVYGAKRARMVRQLTRVTLIALSPAIPLVRLIRLARKALAIKRDRLRFLAALPYLWILTMAWSCGELYGYLKPAGKMPIAQKPHTIQPPHRTAQREEQTPHGAR